MAGWIGAVVTVAGLAVLAMEYMRRDRFPAAGFAVTGSGATVLVFEVTESFLPTTAFILVYGAAAAALYRIGRNGEKREEIRDPVGEVADVIEKIDGEGRVELLGGGKYRARNAGEGVVEVGERVRIVEYSDGEVEVVRGETEGSFHLGD